MSDPFLSEIRMMSFGYAPKGWATCDGQQLPINQNQALFSLLGTTFGGNGTTTFALPNYGGRTPIHVGSGYSLGAVGGEQNHTLVDQELPAHTHRLSGSSTTAELNAPSGSAYLGQVANTYTGASNLVVMSSAEIGPGGPAQPHQNMQPFLSILFSIALQGIYPSRS